jgi:hypothetical protein
MVQFLSLANYAPCSSNMDKAWSESSIAISASPDGAHRGDIPRLVSLVATINKGSRALCILWVFKRAFGLDILILTICFLVFPFVDHQYRFLRAAC